MAAVSATFAATSAPACFLQKPGSISGTATRFSPPNVVGLPALGRPRVTCSANKAEQGKGFEGNAGAFLCASAALGVSNPALALVDERLSTEGTGLSLGLSNPLLGWVLVGVAAIIWALYFIYTSSLEEDEESGGLSL